MWRRNITSQRIHSLILACVTVIYYTAEPVRCEDNSENIQKGPTLPPALEKELEEISLDQYIIAEAEKRLKKAEDVYLYGELQRASPLSYNASIDAGTNEKLMTEDFLDKSYSLAAALRTLGCKKDTIVGIMSENRLEYPIVILATFLAGATFTAFIPGYTVDELRPVFNIAQPKIVFCATNHCEKIMQVAAGLEIEIIVLDWSTSSSASSVVVGGKSFLQLVQSRKDRVQVENRPGDVACILYSSGTTGVSKGVMLTHKNIVFILKLLQENLVQNNGPMNMCLTLMCHISGFLAVLGAVVRNETLVIMQKRYSEGLFLSAIERYQVKRTLLTPGMITFLLTNPEVNRFDLSSLKFISCGSAPITGETEEALKTKFGLEYVQQMYGMTESTMYTLVKDPENPKRGTCGTPVPGVEIKVVNFASETKESLGSDKTGEIYIRGPSVAKGYFNNVAATNETIDEDGWLHSGDVGYYDKNGDFFIVDRIKELLKVEDLQVAPAEIEGILQEHPGVAECAVVGIPDKLAGQLPKAFVIKKDGVVVTKDDLISFVAGKVLPQKRLRGGVEFVTEIPKNSTGKILRRQLLKEWIEKHSKRE